MVLLQYDQTMAIIIIRNSVTSVCAFHNILLFIYHMNHTPICGNQKKSFRLLNLSISTLVFLCFYTTFGCVFAWFLPQSQLACTWIIKIGVTSYALSKVIVYFFIMERLFLIFQQTSYGFNKMQKSMARMISAVFVFVTISICVLFTDGTFHSDPIDCTSDIPLWILVYGAGSDVSISMALSVTFSRKLLHINLTMVENTMNDIIDSNSKSVRSRTGSVCTNKAGGVADEDPSGVAIKRVNSIQNINENDATFKILTKSTLLTFVALFSTQLQLSLAGIIGLNAPLSAIDSVINGWCCMLMFSRYHHIYSKMCGKMEKCITINCLSCWSCNCCCELEVEKETKARSIDTDNQNNVQNEVSLKEIIVSETEMEDIDGHRPISISPSDDKHDHIFANLGPDSEPMDRDNVNVSDNDKVDQDINSLDVKDSDYYHTRNQSTAL